jgi:hypothetical protein
LATVAGHPAVVSSSELVPVVAITGYQPPELIEPEVTAEEAAEVVPLEAFRYILKRPAN